MVYRNCRFCHGDGCLACESERRKDQERAIEPIFVADPTNEDDMALLKEVFGRSAIEKAFGPDGEGIREIKINALLAQISQMTRKDDSST